MTTTQRIARALTPWAIVVLATAALGLFTGWVEAI